MTPRLEVHLPPEADGSDEAIVERALRALFPAAPFRRERILLRIARGQVRLSGTVGTGEERTAIERLVAGVEGVADVDNQVTVEGHGRTTGVTRGVAPMPTAATPRAATSPAASRRSSCARPDWAPRRS